MLAADGVFSLEPAEPAGRDLLELALRLLVPEIVQQGHAAAERCAHLRRAGNGEGDRSQALVGGRRLTWRFLGAGLCCERQCKGEQQRGKNSHKRGV